ncbi:MAG: hypothetical protein AAGJ35_13350, partial [Myxococcota bacterium]
LLRVLRVEDTLRGRAHELEEEQLEQLCVQMEQLERLDQHDRDLLPSEQAARAARTCMLKAIPADVQREREQVLLLYEDYLEGTPLHRSDVRATNQLLGHLMLQNICRHRLKLKLLEQLRIDRLDLSRAKILLYLGPYLWFAAITESMAQRISRLLVEFNQFCIPLEQMAWATESQKQDYLLWKARRIALLEGSLFEQVDHREKPIERPFLHSEFTALNFLSDEEERDQRIAEFFGEDVMVLVQAERQALIREIFGFYPFHQFAKEQRTLNPYQWYMRYGASGRIFLSPLAVLWWMFSGIFRGGRHLVSLVRDILKPPAVRLDRHQGWASFNVAVRKLNRMRKPLYMETMRLRALLDVEYLGLYLPGHQRSGLEQHDLEFDLDFMNAFEQEREEFQ